MSTPQIPRLYSSHPHGHLWLRHFVHGLEYDPALQYRVHLYAAVFWLCNLVIIAVLLIFFPDVWNGYGVFYVATVSLYANFATDWGAMSACLAAMHMGGLPEIPTEPRQPPLPVGLSVQCTHCGSMLKVEVPEQPAA